jgi:PKD repeat protein
MFMSIKRIAQIVLMPLAISSLLSTQADAQTLKHVRERMRPAFPQITHFERQSSGQAAVNKLGARLQDVASWYGKSAEGLRRELLSDRRLRIDGNGRMFVVEEMEAPVRGATAEVQQTLMEGQLVALDQTFLLNSRPGANRTIYLDFDGATLTGTAWNTNGNTITAKPFDIDGVTETFSTTELQRIQYIWQRVAEDYAPFDVNVTTQAPSADQLARTDLNDQTYGTTVLITHNSGVYNCSCGGIAYIGVFNDTSTKYKPALVFYNMLGGGDEKAVAEAISHETGHNIGLSHDGTSSAAYYTGQGSDPATSWAPIMGVGYYKTIVQFSRGEYANANNKEDDFAVAQSNGLPLRADDFGNSISAASPIWGSRGGTVDGVIEQAGDADVFFFTAAAGAFTASLAPSSRSANADLVLTLFDASGAQLATHNPLDGLGASLSYQLPAAGTYYIEVRTAGLGDPASTGYTSYGSVGNYRVSTSFQSGGTPPSPVLTASASTGIAPVAITLDASQSTAAEGGVKFFYWDFGDGTTDTTGTLQTVTKTYGASGNYTVRLTVVDDKGLSAITSQVISVAAATPAKAVSIRDLDLSLSVTRTGSAKARAAIVVVNQQGQVMRGAVVSAVWSGVVSKAATLRSSRFGKANFTSPTSKATGCYTLTVTGISLAGYTVDQSSLRSREICR